jgi:dihydrofolate reductase
MRVTLIAALASNGVIGRDNQIPWRIPGDLPRFKQLTMGQTLVMGRKTYQSIGRPLPGRTTIVISRDPALPQALTPAGVKVVRSLEEALAAVQTEECFIAGGGEIYALALPRADRLLLTEVEAPFEGDAYFPPFPREEWRLAEEERHEPSPAFPHAFAYRTYFPTKRKTLFPLQGN